MIFRFILRSWLFLATMLLALPSGAQNRFVHRDGRLLKDSTSREIKLRGVNLGGWMLWEEWIWGGKFKSQDFIEKGLVRLVGSEETQKFNETIFRQYITEEDIREIGARGFNVVRIPINHRLFDTLAPAAEYKGIGWEILDQTLSWCKKHHVYAVIDLHGAPGGQSPYFIADPVKPNLWKTPAHQQKTIALWTALAERYKNNTAVAGYDLLNEPIPDNDQHLSSFYSSLVKVIRSADKNHLLIIEGSAFATKFEFFTSLPDENMAMSFHVYTWFGGDPLKKVQKHIETSRRLNVPMWCGEWGENKYEIIENTRKILDDPANGFSGWCFWTWKKAQLEGKFPALNGIQVSDEWKTIINGVNKPLGKLKLTREQVIVAMHAFAAAAVYSNCRHDDTLMKLLTGFEGNKK